MCGDRLGERDVGQLPRWRAIRSESVNAATARYLSLGPMASATPRYFGAATMGSMALIVFFRGINVGGHRAFRPSLLAKELGIYDAVNVGAAGTLVIRKPGLRAKFLAELRRKLPFEATIAFCDGRDLIRLEMANPFGTEPPRADVVQFVSILSEAERRRVVFQLRVVDGAPKSSRTWRPGCAPTMNPARRWKRFAPTLETGQSRCTPAVPRQSAPTFDGFLRKAPQFGLPLNRRGGFWVGSLGRQECEYGRNSEPPRQRETRMLHHPGQLGISRQDQDNRRHCHD